MPILTLKKNSNSSLFNVYCGSIELFRLQTSYKNKKYRERENKIRRKQKIN